MKPIKNIKLRKIKRADLLYFLKWWKDKKLIELTSGIYERSNKILTGYFLEMFSSSKDHHYIITLNSKKIIGNVSLTHRSKKILETHIVIGEKKYWGKGYGVFAIRQALQIAFNKLGYEKAYLKVRPENIRAIKAYEKCGFIKAGLKRYPSNKNQLLTVKMILKRKNFNCPLNRDN